jgi:glycosyltransferase involved in cell wall biosynthesis
MMYLVMPLGGGHGWGVCGRYLAKELAKRDQVTLITDTFSPAVVGDELDYYALRPLVERAELDGLNGQTWRTLHSPMLQAIGDSQLLPLSPRLTADHSVGYTFFEDNLLSPQALDNARSYFQHIATGSSWCTAVLRDYGLTEVSTVLQGVDSTLFFDAHRPKEYFQDRFVVFSGGKLELRKGQDLVIRAFKVLQDRHPDVLLITSWFNQWEFSLRTISASPYISTSTTKTNQQDIVTDLLVENGIDQRRALVLPPQANSLMARIYRNTDVGLFPNRCEGGTNLVLMEYMACGRPVVAAYNSGHKDIVNDANALLVRNMRPMTISTNDKAVAIWDDPSLDETIEQLEFAYQHRAALRSLGQQAACDLSQLTWSATADSFYRLLQARA